MKIKTKKKSYLYKKKFKQYSIYLTVQKLELGHKRYVERTKQRKSQTCSCEKKE